MSNETNNQSDSRSLAPASAAESGSPVPTKHAAQASAQQAASDPEQRAAELLAELTELATRCPPDEEAAAHNDAGARICRELDHLIETGAVPRGRVAAIADACAESAFSYHLEQCINGDPTQQAIAVQAMSSCRLDQLHRVLDRREDRPC